MFLVKCKCGSTFTIRAEAIKDRFPLLDKNARAVICPNCKSVLSLYACTSLCECENLPEQVESVSYIPDNATITVTFNT